MKYWHMHMGQDVPQIEWEGDKPKQKRLRQNTATRGNMNTTTQISQTRCVLNVRWHRLATLPDLSRYIITSPIMRSSGVRWHRIAT